MNDLIPVLVLFVSIALGVLFWGLLSAIFIYFGYADRLSDWLYERELIGYDSERDCRG